MKNGEINDNIVEGIGGCPSGRQRLKCIYNNTLMLLVGWGNATQGQQGSSEGK